MWIPALLVWLIRVTTVLLPAEAQFPALSYSSSCSRPERANQNEHQIGHKLAIGLASSVKPPGLGVFQRWFTLAVMLLWWEKKHPGLHHRIKRK